MCANVTGRENKSHCRTTYHIMVNRFENRLTNRCHLLKKRKKRGTEQSTPYTHSISFSLSPTLSTPSPLFLYVSVVIIVQFSILDASFTSFLVGFPLSPLPQAAFFKCPRIFAIYHKTYFVNLPSPYVYGTQLIYIDNN